MCESTQLYKLCKACSSAQNCAALWKYMYKRYCGLRTIRGLAQVPHWQCTTIKLCQSALPIGLPRRLACRREDSWREKRLLKASFYTIRAKKSRGGAPARRPAPRASKRGRAPPPPPAWPAHNLLFDTQRRRREKKRLSDAFVKRVFQEQVGLRCAAGHPIARFATQAYALIVLLSTHGASCSRKPRNSQGEQRQKKN